MLSSHIRWSAALVAIGIFSGTVAQATPITSGLQVWLKADAIGGLSNGQNVTEWLDSSAEANSAYSALQNTANNKPIYVTNAINGLPVVRFEDSDLATSGDPAVDDWMAITTDNAGTRASFSALDLTSGVTIFAVVDATGSRNRAPIFGGQEGEFDVTASSPTPRIRTYRSATPVTYAGSPGGFFIAQYQHSNIAANQSNSVEVFANGTSVATDNFTNGSADLLSELVNLGTTDELGDAFFGGDLAELLVYSGVLSETDRNAVGVYLESKYALDAAYVPEPAAASLALGMLALPEMMRRRSR